MNAVVERVQMERRMRGWSIRTASAVGGISNQTWSTFEQTGRATPSVQVAVMKAFGWPENWQDALPPAPPMREDELAELRAEIAALRAQLAELQPGLAQLGWFVQRLKIEQLEGATETQPEQFAVAAEGSTGEPRTVGRRVNRPQPPAED